LQTTGTIVAGLLIIASIYVVAMNWACVIITLRNRRRKIDRYYSTVPIITFILAALALMVWPFRPNWWIILIPVADIANLNLMIWPFWWLISAFRKRCFPKN
jgi:hypothetical protein